MADKLKIGVVIVTFNNSEMLQFVIKSLLCQTRMPDEIIVIDNASSDNTGSVVKNFPQIRYVCLTENTGSAGGFYEGIRIAIEHNDFVMTLDDDIELKSNALEAMEKHIISLSREHKLGAIRCWFYGQNSFEDVRKITDFAWRGTLINRDAIVDAGLPKKEYFLYAEDVEYSYRLGQRGWDMFIVPEHLMVNRRENDGLMIKVFGRDKSVYKDKFRHYYAIRNEINMYLTYRRWRKLMGTVMVALKNIVLFVVFKRMSSFGFIEAVIRGVLDGFRSKLGKNPKYLP